MGDSVRHSEKEVEESNLDLLLVKLLQEKGLCFLFLTTEQCFGGVPEDIYNEFIPTQQISRKRKRKTIHLVC